jgi:outer membrane protein assembly factor BamD (BamD/ComL family)
LPLLIAGFWFAQQGGSMAVAGVLSSSIFDILNQVSGQHNAHNKFQQIEQEFQQLGSDLQSGNLSQAQTDFAALQQNLPSAAQSSAAALQTSSVTTNFLTAAVNQLAQMG